MRNLSNQIPSNKVKASESNDEANLFISRNENEANINELFYYNKIETDLNLSEPLLYPSIYQEDMYVSTMNDPNYLSILNNFTYINDYNIDNYFTENQNYESLLQHNYYSEILNILSTDYTVDWYQIIQNNTELLKNQELSYINDNNNNESDKSTFTANTANNNIIDNIKTKTKSSLPLRKIDPDIEIYNPPKFKGDKYSPCFIKGYKGNKKGMCPECYYKKNKVVWLKMKHSGYWYHMNNIHGIASNGYGYKEPIKTRSIGKLPLLFTSDKYNDDNQTDQEIEILQGLCHQCYQWIDLNKYPNKSKIENLLWKKHVQKCHFKKKVI